jgi:hypothetical protein
MEELIAMMLLGAMGSGLDPKTTTRGASDPEKFKADLEKFKKDAEAKRKEYQEHAKERMLEYAKRDAEFTRMVYESYLKAGFTADQALELVKVNLADSKNIKVDIKKGTGENNG